jgi:4-aminobutyrate--pyruvate transaminase
MEGNVTTRVEELAQRDLAHIVHPLARHRQLKDSGPVVVVAGDGAEVTLDDGRTMIDGPAGMWCVVVGHGRTELIEAGAAQLQQLAFSPLFGGLTTEPAIELAARLAELAPGDLDHVFLVNGGSEANETAMKLARYYWYLLGRPEKTTILAHDRGYHGVTGAATYATGLAPYHVGFGPATPSVAHFPSPYAYRTDDAAEWERIRSGRALEERITELGADNVAAVIVEPVLGSGGVLVPPDGYLHNLRAVCDRHQVLLITDEVITGFGRTGRWFAAERDGIVPDMLTFAKGVTSGYAPLGGTMISDSVWQTIYEATGDPALMHGFTTSGHPVSCAIAVANIDVIEREGLVEQVNERGAHLGSLLESLRELPEVGDVRYRGLMAAVELVKDRDSKARYPKEAERAHRVTSAARDHGLLVRPLLGDMVFLAPPFVISEAQLEQCVEALRRAIIETAPASLAPAASGAAQ